MSESNAKMAQRVRAAYDAAADTYVERFRNELDKKPLDRELLARFADAVRGKGIVWEVGAGPGQIGEFVRSLGPRVHGTDLCFGPLVSGRQLSAAMPRVQSDMLASPARDASLAGVLAFYAICHLSGDELPRAFREIHRVLQPGGTALISFHIGEECRHFDDFLGHPADLDFQFFAVANVVSCLRQAGFAQIEPIERDPYPDAEAATRRAYVFAVK